MNVTILGHVCIDHNVSEGRSYTAPGGPAVFMMKVLNRMPNTNVEVIAPGKKIKPGTTLIYENRSKGGRRTQKAFNLKYAKPQPITNRLKDTIHKSDLIFFAPLTPDYNPDYISSLLEKTKKGAVKIISPQGYFRDVDQKNNVIQRDFVEADRILPLFDFAVVSKEDHKNMRELARVWSKHLRVITTLEEKGAHYLYKGKSILARSNPVKRKDIVDSVGSGDIFTASFGYKYFFTKDVKKSLRFANDIARQSLFS